MYEKSKKYEINLLSDEVHEIDVNFRIEIEVDYLKGFYVRGLYKKKYDNGVLLYEKFYNDVNIILTNEEFDDIILEVLEGIADKRNLLIDVDEKLSKLKHIKLDFK